MPDWKQTQTLHADRQKTLCRWCDCVTINTGTRTCDSCWELEARLTQTPDIALKMLQTLPGVWKGGEDE